MLRSGWAGANSMVKVWPKFPKVLLEDGVATRLATSFPLGNRYEVDVAAVVLDETCSFIRCNPPAMLGQICAVLPSHIDLNELMYSTGVRMSQTWSHNPYIEKQNDTLSCLHLALTSFLRFSHLVCCFDGVKLALVY